MKWLASSPSLLGGDRASFDKLARNSLDGDGFACARFRARVNACTRGVDHGDERVRREAADNRGLLRHGVVYATLIVAPRRAVPRHIDGKQPTEDGLILPD